MNILSLFDGMSCGQQALKRCGFEVTNYFASEIDKHAIKVTQHNYPNTIQLGSVVNVDGYSLPKIDLLLGGSPCQSFSFAGKRKGMSTKDEQEILTLEHYLQLKQEGFEFEGQSYLFWEYMRLLNELRTKNPNVYFLLENVEMGEKWELVLSRAIGVKGIHINSALVSAQNRKRIYWTNIGMKPAGLFGDLESIIDQPKDKGILLKDILESQVDEKYFLSENFINKRLKENIQKHTSELEHGTLLDSYNQQIHKDKSITINTRVKDSNCTHIVHNMKPRSAYITAICHTDNIIKIDKKGNIKSNQDKASCFTAGGHSGGNHSDMDLIVHNMQPRSGDPTKGGTGHLTRNDGKTYCLDTNQSNAVEIFNNKSTSELKYKKEIEKSLLNDKSTTIDASYYKGFGVRNGLCRQITELNSRIRRLTPVECERLQTVEDNYTNCVSDSQRYKMLGNGWTIDVICHILNYLKNE